MKKVLFFLLAMGLLVGTANAELIDRGGGLIYDTDLNITWLQDANYARTSGYTTGGFTYYDALAWVNQLVYRGIDGWRLPSAGSNPQQGYYQTSNELGHLFYIELQIPAGTSSTTPINTGPFINLDHGWYWLESELEPYLGGAWYFVFNTGFMHATGKDSGANAWAVHDGDVGLGTISIDIYNTGVDDYGALLPGASIDPHYTLITSADSRFPGPEAFVVVPSGYPLPGRWFANNSTSQWIAPQAEDFAGSGSPDALADGIYIYRTTFNLSGLDPLTAVLSGGWSTDNAGVDILINGVSTGFTTGIEQFEQGFASFSISSGFVHGENTLDFVVRNGAPGYWENSPTGLRVEITGTADPLLEPLNIDIKLIDSNSTGISGGIVKYYAGGWKDFGTTDSTGKASLALEPGSYTFRMTYAGASIDKTLHVDCGSTVIFQTVNTTVQLKNSGGNPIDAGTVKYYAGGWRDMGATSGGQVSKELLPCSYTFRMTYEGASRDKTQNVGINPTVLFQTVNVAVQLKNSGSDPMDTGIVKYYAGGWRDFGTTIGGQVNKELLGGSYTFRMTYGGASSDKTQDVGNNPSVVFQTVNTIVQLMNSVGSLFDSGTVKYYAGGWRDFGLTSGGQTSKELLPGSYTFRMIYKNASNDKTQNVASVQIVKFQTGKVVSGSGACTKFYAGGWQTFSNGMELLPLKYTFRFNDGTVDTPYTITAATTNNIH